MFSILDVICILLVKLVKFFFLFFLILSYQRNSGDSVIFSLRATMLINLNLNLSLKVFKI